MRLGTLLLALVFGDCGATVYVPIRPEPPETMQRRPRDLTTYDPRDDMPGGYGR